MSPPAEAPDPRAAAEAVARRSYGKLIAFLAARTGDIAAAEDALSEAFAEALEHWPVRGSPGNPEAWLLTVARRKLIDTRRREDRAVLVLTHLESASERAHRPDSAPSIPDQRLALLFACAHPAIDPAVRAPLMLQVALGVSARAIAAAFLTSAEAMGKRLVRAKDKIRQAGIPLAVPEPEELRDRLDAVLEAIYGAFSEGWTDPAGTDPARRDLAGEAIFLARLVVDLLPDAPEAMGLLALLLHLEARRDARRGTSGEYLPLSEQDQARWHWSLVEEAERLLRGASRFGVIGRYQLEGAIQSAHVFRCRTGASNWPEVVGLYDALISLTGSPVVALNRVLAVAEVEGAGRALTVLDDLAVADRLAEYQPYWAVRAELLARTGALDAARDAYRLAIGLERDPAVRRFLLQRQAKVEQQASARQDDSRSPRQ